MAENEKTTSTKGGARTPAGNPLLSKNIPPPPPTTAPPATHPGEQEYSSTTASQDVPAVTSYEDERATIELSLYLRPTQDDKLEDLRRAYKRRTGKKISANEVIRRLIENATLEMLDIHK